MPARRSLRFGPYELDVRSRELHRNGSRVSVPDQPLAFLTTLLERPGEIVTREELRQRLWPGGTFVDFEHGLNAAVKRLRDALGDSADAPQFIETVPRRGYRFVAPVEDIGAAAALPEAAAPSDASEPRPPASAVTFTRRGRRRALVAIGATALLVACAVAAWLVRSRPPAPPSAMRVVRLSAMNGSELGGSFSPDAADSVLRPDPATMSLHNGSRDVQTEADPASIVLGDLNEAIENGFQLVVGDTRSCVANGEAHVSANPFDMHDNFAAGRRELERVAQQIREHLEQPGGIKRDGGGRPHNLHHQRDAICGCLRQKSVHGLEHDRRRVSDAGRHRKLARVNARDVHEVSDQAGHPSGGALNTPSAQPHLLLVIVPRHGFRDDFRGAADRVQHVPEVMTDDAQKFISRGKRVVGPSALSCQVRVGVVPFS